MGNVPFSQCVPIHSRYGCREPHCYDELEDWCSESTEKLSQVLASDAAARKSGAQRGALSSIERHKFVPRLRNEVDQNDKPEQVWPSSDIERMISNNKIVIVATSDDDFSSAHRTKRVIDPSDDPDIFRGRLLSLSEFSLLSALLRRLVSLQNQTELWEVRQNERRRDDSAQCHVDDGATRRGASSTREEEEEECAICMDRKVQVVLPCLHGMCSACSGAWVERRWNCPMCRNRLERADYRKNQWLVEAWSREDAANERRAAVIKLEELWSELECREFRRDDFQALTPPRIQAVDTDGDDW
mmetsp:Transcript_25308/g.47079  ORF Transcript_25308/g.47079 Transcript_25308/m.47079 type:complete len:301 (-) Transcript_25308:501-1403(-)